MVDNKENEGRAFMDLQKIIYRCFRVLGVCKVTLTLHLLREKTEER